MAENKKSVVLYTDLIHTFEQLTDAQAGRLVKHLFRYVNDQNPSAPDKITSIAFEPIKQQLKRDLKKWEKYIEKQKENGKKGGRPKQAIEQEDKGLFSVTDKIVPNHSEHGHFAYLLYDKVSDEYKFGETGNLIKRWYAIKRPKSNLIVYDFVMLPAFDCQQIERELINKYQDVRISGDWFKLNEEMVEAVLTFFSQKSQAYSGYPKKADTATVNDNVTVINVDEEERADEFTKNQIWKSEFCAAKNISPAALEKLQQEFITEKKLKGEHVNNYKRYFLYWYENRKNGTHQQSTRKSGKAGKSEGANILMQSVLKGNNAGHG